MRFVRFVRRGPARRDEVRGWFDELWACRGGGESFRVGGAAVVRRAAAERRSSSSRPTDSALSILAGVRAGVIVVVELLVATVLPLSNCYIPAA